MPAWTLQLLFVIIASSHLVLGRQYFSCSADEFECAKSQTCTRLSWRCDGEEDCMDGEDEIGCPHSSCKPGFFKCRDGKCIDETWVCDGTADCKNKDDEAPIQNCNQTTCSPSDFQCRNGECIPKSFHCDRDDDCEDKSDEQDCPELACSSTEFKCANNNSCISLNQKCNGLTDCADGSDERNCPAGCNPQTELTCGNGECFPSSFRCDGDKDCLNGTDEVGCPPQPTFKPCEADHFQCRIGDCVPITWQCDGYADCSHGDDERDCPPACEAMQFTCGRSGKCISQHSRCDGFDDCSDGSDEEGCEPPSLCGKAGAFKCGSSKYCINETKVCDRFRDCPGGEDEAPNCGIDECTDHNGHCSHKCRDLPINYECYCNDGFKLANDNRSCEDLNECEDVYGSCSQTCVNTKGGFKCSCVEGYRLETATTDDTCKATGPQAHLVFGSEHSVHNLTTSGTHYGVIVSNRKAPIAISHDLKNGYVYWTDMLDGKIERARLVGDGIVETVVDKVEHSNGIAIDWIGRKIYWTDETLKTIEVCELDGKNRLQLFTVRVDVPRGIAVDPFERYIFWSDWSGLTPKIERASMDGDPISRRTILDTDLTWPTALTLDTISQRVFFADTKVQRIETIRYDGSGRKVLVSRGLVHPLGLVVFEDRLYYTDYSLNTIFIVNRRTGQRLGELKSNLRRPSGINVVHPLDQRQVPTQCSLNNGGCSHLCLLSSTSFEKYSCRCPNRMLLQSDGKSCAPVGGQSPTASQPPVQPTKIVPSRNISRHTGEPSAGGAPKTEHSDGPLAKKREGSSKNYGPMIAGVTVAIVVTLFLILAVFLYWRRRVRMADRSILFYKDTSTTPLQNDFDDDDLVKNQDEIGGISRVEFT